MTIENANSHPYRVAIVKDTEGLFANSHPYKVVIEGGGGGYEARVVDELPEEGEVGYIYLVLKETTSEGDIYDEWMWVLQQDGTTYGWEHLGTTNEVTIKLYDEEGDNTDGAATQRLATSLKGKARILTTADYNYPVNNPTQVSLYRLEPGLYTWAGGVDVRPGDTGYPMGYYFAIVPEKLSPSNSYSYVYCVGNNSSDTQVYQYNSFVCYRVDSGGLASIVWSAASNQSVDSIRSYLRLENSAPTTSTTGYKGALWIDGTNGKLYQCTAINTSTSPATYTWEEVGGGGGPTVVQTTGTSTTDVMSQNAVTATIFNNPSTKTAVKIGTSQLVNDYRTVSIGYNSQAYGMYGVVIGESIGHSQADTIVGYNALHEYTDKPGCVLLGANTQIGNYQYSVALGYDSGRNINADGMVDVGLRSTSTLGYNGGPYRLVTGLYDPQNAHDAATKGYVDTSIVNAISGIVGVSFEVVQTLPALGNPGVIYLLPNQGTTPNIYDEYVWIEQEEESGDESGSTGYYELIGTTQIDLSDYVTTSDLNTALGDYTPTSSLSAVATSGDYEDLLNAPETFSNAEWNALWGEES